MGWSACKAKKRQNQSGESQSATEHRYWYIVLVTDIEPTWASLPDRRLQGSRTEQGRLCANDEQIPDKKGDICTSSVT